MNGFNGKKFTVNKVFIDSNIWIYAFITLDDQTKRNTCIQLLENLYQEQVIVVSTQVIMEVHWNLIKKYGIRDEDAKLKIEAGILEIAKLSVTSKSTYDYAFNLRQQQNISFWDSLIVAAALENNCSILYTEDLQHNQLIENQIKIINPFKNTQM
jgi:predicted nucleic acid-binding protein